MRHPVSSLFLVFALIFFGQTQSFESELLQFLRFESSGSEGVFKGKSNKRQHVKRHDSKRLVQKSPAGPEIV